MKIIPSALFLSAGLCSALLCQAGETVTIATVNNSDMIRMQRLSKTFEQLHADVKLNWVVLEENVLRQRLTTDIATQGGQFDVLTIGTYETPLWGAKHWLEPIKDLPASYDLEDIFPAVRQGLSVNDTLYALPLYGESTVTYYRTDLFKNAGLSMPEHPTWTQLGEFAGKLHQPDKEQYGMCLRGKAGWGENMALLTTMSNAFGARWFNEQWQPPTSTSTPSSSTAHRVCRAMASTRRSPCSTVANAQSGSMPASPARSSPTQRKARWPMMLVSSPRQQKSPTRVRPGSMPGHWPSRRHPNTRKPLKPL
jgi:ABC-type glycerol-3-phosphate transport system substrate-binding protein